MLTSGSIISRAWQQQGDHLLVTDIGTIMEAFVVWTGRLLTIVVVGFAEIEPMPAEVGSKKRAEEVLVLAWKVQVQAVAVISTVAVSVSLASVELDAEEAVNHNGESV